MRKNQTTQTWTNKTKSFIINLAVLVLAPSLLTNKFTCPMLMLLLKYCNSGTVSCWRKAQVLHSVLHEFSELLPFWPPVEVHSLLVDLLSSFSRVPGGPPAQAPCPLHALPAQQRVVGLVTGCRVPVIAAAAELLLAVFGVLPLLHADGDLRLERKVAREMKGCIKWKQTKMLSLLPDSAVEHGVWLQWSCSLCSCTGHPLLDFDFQ